MYARVLRLQGDASKADAVIENYESRVAPALREQGGYAGARLLVDREQGRSMSVTFWRDEAAARAMEAALSDVRRGAVSAFGAEDSVSEYFEILVQHRPLPTEAGNWVRVTDLAGDPAKVDDGVAHYKAQVIPGVEALTGFRAAVLFGDRTAGKACRSRCGRRSRIWIRPLTPAPRSAWPLPMSWEPGAPRSRRSRLDSPNSFRKAA
jgi:heme-degrading monooxygenase HmoA